MICEVCRTNNPDGTTYCTVCGNRLTKVSNTDHEKTTDSPSIAGTGVTSSNENELIPTLIHKLTNPPKYEYMLLDYVDVSKMINSKHASELNQTGADFEQRQKIIKLHNKYFEEYLNELGNQGWEVLSASISALPNQWLRKRRKSDA